VKHLVIVVKQNLNGLLINPQQRGVKIY